MITPTWALFPVMAAVELGVVVISEKVALGFPP